MDTQTYRPPVQLPGYLLSEILHGSTAGRFRVCHLITRSIWGHGLDATPADELVLWRRLYVRELQRSLATWGFDSAAPARPLLLPEIRERTVPDRTLPRSA